MLVDLAYQMDKFVHAISSDENAMNELRRGLGEDKNVVTSELLSSGSVG